MVSGGRTFGWLDHEGRVLINGTHALIRDSGSFFNLSHHMRTQLEERPPKNQSGLYLTLSWLVPQSWTSEPPELWEKKKASAVYKLARHSGILLYACTLSHFSRVQLFATLWTTAYQALCPGGFSRQSWSRDALLQGIFPTQGLNWYLVYLLHWQAVLYH